MFKTTKALYKGFNNPTKVYLTDKCKTEVSNRSETLKLSKDASYPKKIHIRPNFMMLAKCKDDIMDNPFGGKVAKSQLGWIVVCIDMFVVVAFLVFTAILE